MRPRRPLLTLASTLAAVLSVSACGSQAADPRTDPTSPTPTATMETGPSNGTTTEAPETIDDLIEGFGGDSPDAEPGLGEVSGVPVYYLVESSEGPRLVREFRTVPEHGDPITTAVHAMMAVPPQDPDYWSAWVAPDDMSVTRQEDRITIDVPSSVFGHGVGAAEEEISYAQLVYTATAAAAWIGEPVSEVVLLENGAPGDGWGHVGVGDPWTRSPALDVVNHVWLLSPTEGESVPAGPVTFRGYGASFEANFVWYLTGEGVELSEPTTGTNGIGFGDFEFTVDLAPGTYTVTVGNSHGKDDSHTHTDSKSFVVR